MDKQLYRKATSLKDDIANTKALINGLAETFSDDPDTLYKPWIYWSHVMRSLPLGLKQKLHIEAIRYCNKLEEEFEEL